MDKKLYGMTDPLYIGWDVESISDLIEAHESHISYLKGMIEDGITMLPRDSKEEPVVFVTTDPEVAKHRDMTPVVETKPLDIQDHEFFIDGSQSRLNKHFLD